MYVCDRQIQQVYIKPGLEIQKYKKKNKKQKTKKHISI